jgi:hypothetical protein
MRAKMTNKRAAFSNPFIKEASHTKKEEYPSKEKREEVNPFVIRPRPRLSKKQPIPNQMSPDSMYSCECETRNIKLYLLRTVNPIKRLG